MTSVTITGIEKVFGSTQVIHGVDITIEDREFVVLVGPSGCGKSTLLRMIAGLESISAGELKIGGRIMNMAPPKERNVAMVFQNYALYPHMTVAGNIGFSLKLAKTGPDEIKQRVGEVADLLGLTEYLDRYPRQLSGGQRQRVAMGRAIVRRPQVFLFDEPLSNLDAQLRVQMRTDIRELHQRLGATSIFVTHDQVEAMTMADKIVVMRDGMIEQVGHPLELYDHPANTFVAGFIGSPAMNLISGRISTGQVRVAEGISLPLPEKFQAMEGRDVVYGVRPEHLEIAAKGEGSATKISVIEPTGAEILVITEFAGQKIHVAFRERHDLRPNDILYLRPDVEHLHLFDAETGQRL